MEQESSTNSKNGMRQWLRTLTTGKVVGLVLILLLAIYLVVLLVVPGQQVRRLNRQYEIPEDNEKAPAAFSGDSGIFALQKKKIFLESRLKMSKSDSIGLAVDLSDSLVTLEINGIVLYREKINTFHASKLFRAVKRETYLGMFAEPLRVTSHHSTFEKIPLIYRKVPKDSIEAEEQLSEVPDTTLKKPPLLILTMDHDIQLYFYPYEDLSGRDKFIKLIFNTVQELRYNRQYLSSLIHLKIPAYHSRIKIFMTEREIISLYRALPENAIIALML